MKKLIICFVSLLLVGCATIVAPKVKDNAKAPDRTTPSKGYSTIYNDGLLGYILEGKTVYADELKPGQKLNGEILKVIITSGKRDEYNRLIEQYKLQLKERENLIVEKDNGIQPFQDKYGNNVYTLDAVGVVIFSIFKSWERNQVEPDSIWLKAKDKLKL